VNSAVQFWQPFYFAHPFYEPLNLVILSFFKLSYASIPLENERRKLRMVEIQGRTSDEAYCRIAEMPVIES
jgi:hypothetical protein